MKTLSTENYVPLGALVLQNLRRDEADFKAYFRNMNKNYISKMETALQQVRQMESTATQAAQQKVLKETLYNKRNELASRLPFLKCYAESTRLGGTNISQITDDLRAGEIEDPVQKMRNLLEIYRPSVSVFYRNGMPEGFLDLLANSLDEIESLNNAQKATCTSISRTIPSNKSLYNILYSFISEVCRRGQIVYTSNQKKREGYTIAYLNNLLSACNKTDETKTRNVPGK